MFIYTRNNKLTFVYLFRLMIEKINYNNMVGSLYYQRRKSIIFQRNLKCFYGVTCSQVKIVLVN